MANPFSDWAQLQCDKYNADAEAAYTVALAQFKLDSAGYQKRAEEQFFKDGTLPTPPVVPVKLVWSVVNGLPKETPWTDPNLHAPVFVPPVVQKSSGTITAKTDAVTLEQVAGMLVIIKSQLDGLQDTLAALADGKR